MRRTRRFSGVNCIDYELLNFFTSAFFILPTLYKFVSPFPGVGVGPIVKRFPGEPRYRMARNKGWKRQGEIVKRVDAMAKTPIVGVVKVNGEENDCLQHQGPRSRATQVVTGIRDCLVHVGLGVGCNGFLPPERSRPQRMKWLHRSKAKI